MGKTTIRRAGALGVICLYGLSVHAQEGRESALRMTLDLEQQFSYDSNADLEPGGAPSTTQSNTALTFNLISETPIDTLNLSLGSALRVIDGPGFDGTELDLNNTDLSFSFARDVGHSDASLRTFYRHVPIDSVQSFSDFIDPDTGEVDLPEDFDNLDGGGNRISLGYDIGLELGKDAPLGLELTAAQSVLRYTDTDDPDLFRIERGDFGAQLRATLTPVLDGTLDLSHSTYKAEDEEDTDRFTNTASLGLDYAASEVLSLSARLGYSRSETEENTTGTEIEEGVITGLAATLERPNGTLGLSFDDTVDQNGRRSTLEFFRALEMPLGSLDTSIGLTRSASDDVNVIGGLSWSQDLPTGEISARIDRSVRINTDDDDSLVTAAAISYTHEINDLSSFAISASYAYTDDLTDDDDDATRANATASYTFRLTEDWNLNSGIEFRTSDTDNDARASNHRIFVGIGRRFDLRP